MTFKGAERKIAARTGRNDMKNAGTPRARDDARHWLPSQGVDPAPLAELNAECLGLLATRAAQHAEYRATGVSLPPLLGALRDSWATLSAHAVRRLAAAPFSLFDVGIVHAPRWLELRARGVNDSGQRTATQFFDPEAARSITRRMLLYGWHLARSRPRAACLVFGAPIHAIESLAACSLAGLEAVADRGGDALKPRWAGQTPIWRELLDAASAGADKRLHELLLSGIQRLAAETLAEHPP
jgi:hypothetical protein